MRRLKKGRVSSRAGATLGLMVKDDVLSAASSDVEFSLTIVAVDDHDSACAFWSAFTGWDKTVDVPGVYVEYRTPGSIRLGLYASEHFTANFRGTPDQLAHGGIAATEIYLTVPDLTSSTARAQDLEAFLLDPAAPRAWGETVAYLRAPGDVVLALTQRVSDIDDASTRR